MNAINAKAIIANTCLDALPPATLGDITLREQQRFMVARAERSIRVNGGCLIAEDVGRGKTFIALAVARHWRSTMVVAPATLRATWLSAARQTQTAIDFISHESLSRGTHLPTVYNGIVVDESHHFRNPATRRYNALAEAAVRAPLVLLSATPLQNRIRDLAAQIALFHGERAFALSTAGLARFVLRGSRETSDDLPAVSAPQWIEVGVSDAEVLSAVLQLPAPARPLDGGDAGALRLIGLVRAWASSRAALRSMIRSRRRLATAIEQGLDAGRVPSRREARSWTAADDAIQLGFSGLLIQSPQITPEPSTLAHARASVVAENNALSALAERISATPDPDVARAAGLLRLRAQHPERRILAFSEYASTVKRLFMLLRGAPAVGATTARESVIASGRLSRDELLARFAPVAQSSALTGACESVTLLLATDLLSEGVNLQDASIVVHLDLPWNPARLAQRVGRVRRMGGAAVVSSYLMAPPIPARLLLRTDQLLREKLRAAAGAIGATFDVMPRMVIADDALKDAPADAGLPLGAAEAEGELLRIFARWQRMESPESAEVDTSTKTVDGDVACWLAALSDGRIVSSLAGGIDDSTEHALTVASSIDRSAVFASADNISRAAAELDRWLAAETLCDTCGVNDDTGPLHGQLARWLEACARQIPRHLRVNLLQRSAAIADALARPLPIGAERAIAKIATECSGPGDVILECLERAIQIISQANPKIASDTCAYPVAMIVI